VQNHELKKNTTNIACLHLVSWPNKNTTNIAGLHLVSWPNKNTTNIVGSHQVSWPEQEHHQQCRRLAPSELA
jgi:hypothetical protein